MELEKLKSALSSNETDAKLAEIAGMSQQAISKYRNGLSEPENMRFKNAINLIKFQEEIEMEKQADKIVDAIKCGMHLYGTTEGLTIKEVAKRNEVEANQVIEFLGYEGEGFVVDENYNITGFQEYGYEVINGDMIYIITPDAEELTADQITSVTTGFGGQGYNIDFSIKGLNADLYIDTDYYEWYDGEEVDEEFVKVNFSKIMEEVENKEIKWSIQK